MARRSARISSRASSTPQPIKRVSLSHDAFQAPHTVPAKLAALQEYDEMPGSFPDSPSVIAAKQPCNKRQRIVSNTPEKVNTIIPSREEMHPQATHQSTLKAHEEARWLGFSAMPTISTDAASTPTKTEKSEGMGTPTFKFTFQREQSLELSPAAKLIMQESREEALKIKEQMKADNKKTETAREIMNRKIATPRGAKTRFSDVHNAQFEKMSSIAGHASAFRADPARSQIATPTKSTPAPMKRSPSKTSLLTPSRMASFATTGTKRKAEVQLTKATSTSSTPSTEDSPGKRFKQSEASISHLTTPTKASLAKTSGTHSVKTKIPAPSYQTLGKDSSRQTSTATSTARTAITITSPAKAAMLAHTPVKSTAHSIPATTNDAKRSTIFGRSPIRGIIPQQNGESQLPRTPLLSQSPTRPPAEKNPFKTASPLQNQHKAGTSNLLNRFECLRPTPVKSILRTPQRLYSNDPAKVAAGTHLATPPQFRGRFGRAVPATAPVRKQVDFSSSTIAREAFKEASLSPFTFAPRPTSIPAEITYPSLPESAETAPVSPQRRRQSSGPHDFTFRVGSDIVFAPATTPTKVITTPRAVSAYTIRHVVAESELPDLKVEHSDSKLRKIRNENAKTMAQTNTSPTVTLGSKKRKFDFENEVAERDAEGQNKENEADDHDRAVKRVKISASPKVITIGKKPVANEVKKRTTLGVKPKSAVGKLSEKVQKKPATISMARLNALAQPKKRG